MLSTELFQVCWNDFRVMTHKLTIAEHRKRRLSNTL